MRVTILEAEKVNGVIMTDVLIVIQECKSNKRPTEDEVLQFHYTSQDVMTQISITADEDEVSKIVVNIFGEWKNERR